MGFNHSVKAQHQCSLDLAVIVERQLTALAWCAFSQHIHHCRSSSIGDGTLAFIQRRFVLYLPLHSAMVGFLVDTGFGSHPHGVRPTRASSDLVLPSFVFFLLRRLEWSCR